MSDVILAALDRDLAYVLFGYRVTENDLEPVRSSMRSVETGPGRARLLRFTRAVARVGFRAGAWDVHLMCVHWAVAMGGPNARTDA
jgi:hypothetical protein